MSGVRVTVLAGLIVAGAVALSIAVNLASGGAWWATGAAVVIGVLAGVPVAWCLHSYRERNSA